MSFKCYSYANVFKENILFMTQSMILGDAQLDTALSIVRNCKLVNGAFDDLVPLHKTEVDKLVL